MKTIWKYPLGFGHQILIDMPKGAKILSVISQDNVPTLYALVDPTNPIVSRQVRIYGTGNPCQEDDGLNFIGTVKTHGGTSVWHVFVR